ncbi:MAG: hypothetical protein RBU45_06825 [Myxococcota bacterium]|jgi:hypothetical protein|nr:hypothetical protein [Myxococcota bacterium]
MSGRWQALHLSLPDGESWCEPLDDPRLLGPLDLLLREEAGAPVTVLGTGPLLQDADPAGNWLVAAGESLAWGGILPDFLGRAGRAWRALGVEALVLHGRAELPCALGLIGTGDGCPGQHVLPLDAGCWDTLHPAGTRQGAQAVGSEALRLRLLDRGWEAFPADSAVLLTGPAAAVSNIGSLQLHPLHGRRPDHDSLCYRLSQGGLGSRLVQVHGVVALAFGGGGEAGPHRAEDCCGGVLDEEALALRLRNQREWLLHFNGRSVLLSSAARETLYEELVARHLIEQLHGRALASQRLAAAVGAGASAPLRRQDAPLLALGPQLGVYDLDGIEALVRYAWALGLNPLEAGSLVAWAFEGLHDGWLDATVLPVTGPPRWAVDDFDPVEDSLDNATLAGELLEALFLGGQVQGWPACDLRAAARHLGGPAEGAIHLLTAGYAGWQSPTPLWSPDPLVPLCLPVRQPLRDRYELLPPAELGRRAADWLVAELAAANLGIDPELPEPVRDELLLAAHLRRGGSGGWEAHGRELARTLEERSEPPAPPSHRTSEVLYRHLLHAQLILPPDPDLDRWVARLRRDLEAGAAALCTAAREGAHRRLGLG